MIREITRQQIEAKTAQGERVVLIETASSGDYEARHIPGAILLDALEIPTQAKSYFPDRVAEIVIYGKDRQCGSVDEVATRLRSLGYQNLFIYRAGKKDWFTASGYSESAHAAPTPISRGPAALRPIPLQPQLLHPVPATRSELDWKWSASLACGFLGLGLGLGLGR